MRKFFSQIALLVLVSAAPLWAADSLPALDPTAMMPNEWTEFRYERFAIIRANPELAAEDKQLNADIQAQAGKVDSAMIQADPKVGPILIRLAALLRSNWSAPSADSKNLTSADWLAIRTARAAALQANPDLVAANQALLARKKALDAKVDTALVQADPALAPFVSRLQAHDGE